MRTSKSQKDIILRELKDAPGKWVNGIVFVAQGAGFRYAARIHELRKEGHNIESQRGYGTPLFDYRLVEK